MFSLTVREQIVIAGIIFAFVTGAAVKHWWRDPQRAARAAEIAR